MTPSVVFRFIPVIINVLALLYFFRDYRRAKDDAGRRFVVNTAMIFLLMTVVCYNSFLESRHISMSWWQYSLGNVAMHMAMVAAYFLDDQFLSGRVYSLKTLVRHRVFWGSFIFTFLMAAADYVRSDQFSSITDPASFERSWLYATSHIGFHGGLVHGGTHTIVLFYRSLRRYTDFAFIGRCCIFMVGIGLGVFFASFAILNMLTASVIDDRFQVAINTFIQNVGRVTVFPTFVLGFILPKSVYVRIGRPIARYMSWRQHQNQELLSYLHTRMIRIAPSVHLQNEQLRNARLLIEIGDARELIFSQIAHPERLVARQEAVMLFELIRTNQAFDKPGRHSPAEVEGDIVQHSLAVARHLKRFEDRGNNSRWMIKQA